MNNDRFCCYYKTGDVLIEGHDLMDVVSVAVPAAAREGRLFDLFIRRGDPSEPGVHPLPLKLVDGVWHYGGTEYEPQAIITWVTRPNPFSGHVGWVWWANGCAMEAESLTEALADVADLRMEQAYSRSYQEYSRLRPSQT